MIFESETGDLATPIGFKLEKRGPKGAVNADLNQRTAELRALVAALEFKIWSTEGWKKVVIATTSTYVHRGITESVEMWANSGWHQGEQFHGRQVPSFDLWERAIALVNEQAYHGCEVQVWLIPPREGIDAAAAALTMAKSAHATPEVYQSLGDVDITWTGGKERVVVNND